jgi:hypothetical protein
MRTEHSDESVEVLAAMVRRDAADLSLYASFLLNTLSLALPDNQVEVDRNRSLADRARGNEGHVVRVRVSLGDHRWTLSRARPGSKPTSVVEHVVHDVVLSTTELRLDDWCRDVAEAIVREASATASSRSALEQMLLPKSI